MYVIQSGQHFEAWQGSTAWLDAILNLKDDHCVISMIFVILPCVYDYGGKQWPNF